LAAAAAAARAAAAAAAAAGGRHGRQLARDLRDAVPHGGDAEGLVEVEARGGGLKVLFVVVVVVVVWGA
jgi:hypothetical protein